jgi:uncharacterized protein YndB with AHSA1/START domain
MTQEHELRIERLIDAPPEVVFDTFVDPDLQARLHGAGQEGWVVSRAETDTSIGGTSTYAMGREDQEAPDVEVRVTKVFDRPHRLVFDHTMTVPSEGFSLRTEMTLTFEDRDGKTLVTMIQTGFERVEDRDGFGEGWREYLETLDRVATSGDVLKARHDTEGLEARDDTGG